MSKHSLFSLFVAVIGSALIIGQAICGGPAHCAPASAVVDPGLAMAVSTSNRMGFLLLKQLSTELPGSNIVLSPVGIFSGSVIVLNGTAGKTRETMADAMGLSGQSIEDINRSDLSMLRSWQRPDGHISTSFGSALWVQKGVALRTSFMSALSGYGTQFASVDLRSPSGDAYINRWFDVHTGGLSSKVVNPGDMDQAESVFTNAISFYASWSLPFDPTVTSNQVFTLEDGTKTVVPMMSALLNAPMPYLETPNFQAIGLSYGYSGNVVNLYIFLPKKGGAVGSLVATLDDQALTNWIQEMNPSDAQVYLPRFKIDDDIGFTRALNATGFQGPFSPHADFSAMGTADATHIRAVSHQAVLEVNEQGTSGSDATAFYCIQSQPEKFPTINIDHPFFFAIRDNVTGSILFMGVVQKPNERPL